MSTIHNIVRQFKTTYAAVFEAIRVTGLNGRMFNGARVWTKEEVRKIGEQLGKKAVPDAS